MRWPPWLKQIKPETLNACLLTTVAVLMLSLLVSNYQQIARLDLLDSDLSDLRRNMAEGSIDDRDDKSTVEGKQANTKGEVAAPPGGANAAVNPEPKGKAVDPKKTDPGSGRNYKGEKPAKESTWYDRLAKDDRYKLVELFFAFCLLVVAGVQAWIYHRQHGAMVQQIASMERQIELSQEQGSSQANANSAQLELTGRQLAIAELDQRPWIVIGPPTVSDFGTTKGWSYEFTITNKGRTPAYIDDPRFRAAASQGDRPDPYVVQTEDMITQGQKTVALGITDIGEDTPDGQEERMRRMAKQFVIVLAPGDSYVVRDSVYIYLRTEDMVNRFKMSEGYVYFGARILYKDSNGKRLETEAWYGGAYAAGGTGITMAPYRDFAKMK